LSARGADVTGIDPNREALSIARRVAPTGTFRAAGGEAMPFADDSFDGAVFLNSLHHVSEAAFRHYARAAADGRMVLEQPMRAHVLTTRT
jgi:ubiquinone/menaquinone biosynthesis C-methylase UbiE